MYRWDIINHFIKKNGYKSYLEIGYYKGWSFDRIECEGKRAVDPHPCKTSDQETLKEGWINAFKGGTCKENTHDLWKMTSDKFFETIKEDDKYDIIFIDGLHESQQVTKDIQNSLKHLSEGGTIIMHDCNPPQYEHTTTGIDGCWTGDVYKAYIKCRKESNFHMYVIDTDWGVGVINPSKTMEELHPFHYAVSDYWPEFDEKRIEMLNLISIEEFKKLEQYEHITTN